MTDIDHRVVAGRGDLSKVVLTSADGARAEACLHGAHVTSWIPSGGTERLFVSARSAFQPRAAIRGGVPVIFPQFSSVGPLPKHGFARASAWALVAVSPGGSDTASATFRLSSSPATEAIWPRRFVAELSVAVGAQTLELTLSILNTGPEPLTFTAALHTYLAVNDVRETVVHGLAGRTYRDTAAGGTVRREESEQVTIVGEVDRIYLDVATPIDVVEPDRSMKVTMDGFADAVVWNPGPMVSAALADMEPDGYLRMLCVEAAAIGAPVVLDPGGTWTGRQRLAAR